MGNNNSNSNNNERNNNIERNVGENNTSNNNPNNQNNNIDNQFDSNNNRDRALLNSIYMNNSTLLAHNGLYYEYDNGQGSQITVESQKTKKTKAYRNPIMMKKNSLKIEKDAYNDNIYYITFHYLSTAKFNIRIFFNACENNTTNKNIDEEYPKDTNDSNNKNEDTESKRLNRQIDLLKEELIIQEEANKLENANYMNSNLHKSNFKNILPSKQLINKTLIFENNAPGDKEFFSNQAVIDMKFLEEHKIFDVLYFDLIVELEALKENGEVECSLICPFKIIPEASKKGYKMKDEGQKLIVKGIWFELHDVYGFNADANSNECEICYTNKRNTIFLPCKHSYSCNQCASKICLKLNKCPICRLQITDSLIIENENKLNGSQVTTSN